MRRLLALLFITVGFATAAFSDVSPDRLVAAARAQVGVTTSYDPAYCRIAYPGGDVPVNTGVCTDVVIRALRTVGVDLQLLVHEDMRRNFDAYPKLWRLTRTDRNIDHRRVPNLQTYFTRRGMAVAVTNRSAEYRPGDIVSWRLPSGVPHIGIVSGPTRLGGTPRVVHNIGAGAREEDVLFAWTITGHYRWK